MSHFIIPENDENKAWKNSEVMQNFLDIFPEQERMLKAAALSEPKKPLASLAEDKNEEEDSGVDEINVIQTKAQMKEAIVKLNKMASDSVKYGNEKATYMIETTAYKLQDLLSKFDEENR